jgi:hypothetical protein
LKTNKYDFRVKPINIMHNSRFMTSQFFLDKISGEKESLLGLTTLKTAHSTTLNNNRDKKEDPFEDPTHLNAKKNLATDVQPV